MPGKTESVWIIYKKWKVISTIDKLSEYNFWWNYLKFNEDGFNYLNGSI